MQRSSVEVINRLGLHARAAAKLVAVAKSYGAHVTLRRADKSADGKRIMSVLMLEAPRGTVLEVETDGEDEEAAMQGVLDLINDRFGEDE